MSPITARLLAATLLALTAGTACAQATIDQTKALAGNVTTGDSAGFPVTLSAPGHYVLKGNLVVPAGTVGVVITSPDVTLDLNGFSIAGPGTCTRDATTRVVTCNIAFNNVNGISAYYPRFIVRNGSVRGFAGTGLTGPSDMTVERVSSMHNAGTGISANGGSGTTRISDSQVELNAGSGFQVSTGNGGIIERTRVTMNGGNGIIASNRHLVTDSVILGNYSYGLWYPAVKGTVSAGNGTNRASVLSLGGNLDGTTAY